jgi:hypothetical protein
MDQTAFAIALVSIAISVVGLAWQLTLYRLSGARIRIRLTPVLMTHLGTIIQGPEGRWPSLVPDIAGLREVDLWVELAKIDIANIGRTPIWVSGIGLDFGSESRLKPRRRLTMSLQPIRVNASLTDGAPTRLEPGQAVEMFVPLMSSITTAERQLGMHGRITVRGTAVLAGRRPKRSPWRRKMRVKVGNSARFPHAEATRQVLIYQELVNHLRSAEVGQLYEAWLDVWNALNDPGKSKTVENALQPYSNSLLTRIQLAHILRTIFESPQSPATTPPSDGVAASVISPNNDRR